MKYLLSLGGTPVEYTLERKRVKNINLRVRGGEVFVSAARWVPRDVIEQFLLSRAGLILRAIEESAPPRERRWVSGERLFYLGRELTLCVEKGRQSRVTAQGDLLRVEVRETGDSQRVERALAAWYRAESERLCREACDRLYPRFAPLGVPRPEIRMRAMTAAGTTLTPWLLRQLPPRTADRDLQRFSRRRGAGLH